MSTWLQKLKVGEISLVDAGANRGAVSVLMKRAKQTGEDVKELFQKIAAAFGYKSEDVEKILGGEDMDEKILKALQDKVESLEKAQALSKSIGEISVAISKAKTTADLKKIEQDVEKLDKSDNRIPVLVDMVKDALGKAAYHDKYSACLNGDEKTKFDAMPMREKDAYMAKNKVKGMSSDSSSSSSSSSSSEDSKADDMEKRLQAVLKTNTDLSAKVEKMEKTEAIQKIMTTDLKDMVGVAKLDELAESIYKIRKTNSADADLLVAQMKTLAAVAKKSPAFSEIGKNGIDEGSPETKLDKMAKSKAQKEGISYAKAYAAILDTPEGKDLYAEVEKSKEVK